MHGFIVNKTAGSGKGKKVWRKVEKELKRKHLPYAVSFTQKPRDAAKLTGDLLAQGAKTIVVVGGDGTVNEAAEVLVHQAIPLGIVPAGSGNDFARSLGISTHVNKALAAVFTPEPRAIDVLQLGDRYCLTVTGIGFDANVAKAANESAYKKQFKYFGISRLIYLASLFNVLRYFKPATVTLTIDGETHVFSHVWLTAVANSPHYGGNISICPDAVNDDGRFQICVLHSQHKWPLLRLLPKIIKGQHQTNKHISFFSGTDVEVSADAALLVQNDGEIVTKTPVRVTIIEKALTVL